MSTARPATIICLAIAALCGAAMHGPAEAQDPGGQAIRPRPSPALAIERTASQLAVTGDASSAAHEILPVGDSFEQQCLRLLVAVASQRHIGFSHASDRLQSSAFSLLDGLVETAVDCPAAAITVTGHTDSSGDERSNLALSKARAESVVSYMVARGIAADRLQSCGAGSSLPLVREDSARSRAQNRRIEFAFSFAPRAR